MSDYLPPASAAAEAAVAPPEVGLPPLTDEEIAEIEAILGHVFCNKRLVEEALTHASYYFPDAVELSYQRLEFIGDAVLSILVAKEMFAAYPELPPGPLTLLRAANVDTEKLSRVAVNHGLHRFIRHRAPFLPSQIQDFIREMSLYPSHSNGLLDPPKMLADVTEALFGAVYVDSNYSLDEANKVFQKLATPLISPETLGRHPVSELFELCQKTRKELTILKNHWSKSLTVEVLVDGELIASAMYGNKKEIAQNRAAKIALDKLKETLSESQLQDVDHSASEESSLQEIPQDAADCVNEKTSTVSGLLQEATACFQTSDESQAQNSNSGGPESCYVGHMYEQTILIKASYSPQRSSL